MSGQATLFDLEEIAEPWEPVYLEDPPFPRTDTRVAGWDCTRAEWAAWYRASHRCRDCGGLMSKRPHSRGAGGAGREGSWSLCDDCAELAGGCVVSSHRIVREERPHAWMDMLEVAHCVDCGWTYQADEWDQEEHRYVPATADVIQAAIDAHATPRCRPRRGGSAGHLPEEHDGLIAAREKRRTAYLRSAAP